MLILQFGISLFGYQYFGRQGLTFTGRFYIQKSVESPGLGPGSPGPLGCRAVKKIKRAGEGGIRRDIVRKLPIVSSAHVRLCKAF